MVIKNRVRLFGEFVALKPIDEEDFDQIINWRNNPSNNKYLNQPYTLTYDLQKKWYYEKYLESNDILFMIIALQTNEKIGTVGINDINYEKKIGILGRLLIGNTDYRGSKELIEAMVLTFDYIFGSLMIKELYGHCVVDNHSVISFDKKFGFVPTEKILFPHYCKVNTMDLIEMINTKEQYNKSRPNFIKIIEHYKRTK